MSTLAVIPARLAASRLPGKPLRLLAGKPLIVRVWERVADLAIADRIVVATDSRDIEAVVREAGGECVMTSAHHPSGTDRVAEVAAKYRDVDVVLNVQGDEPFVGEDALRGSVELVRSGRFPVGTAAAPASAQVLQRPDVVKVVTDDTGRALYFSRAAIPHLREPGDADARDGLVRQHVGVYAYTPAALAAWVALPPHLLERVERLEQLRPLAAGWAMGVADVADASRGVDTEEDLVRANAYWNDFIAGRS
jgi:3-deoxy-manno-octulosonate cytidylyltransferase (CMP-KDO synthetase)